MAINHCDDENKMILLGLDPNKHPKPFQNGDEGLGMNDFIDTELPNSTKKKTTKVIDDSPEGDFVG